MRATSTTLKLSDSPEGSHAHLHITYPHNSMHISHERCGLPKWLPASKAILNEGMAQLRHEALYSFSDPEITVAPSAARPCALLYPCVARTLGLVSQIKLSITTTSEGTTLKLVHRHHRREALSTIKRILTSTAGQDAITNFKLSLRVVLRLNAFKISIPESGIFPFHLEFLDALEINFPSLRKLRINVEYRGRALESFRLREAILLSFEEQLRRVAWIAFCTEYIDMHESMNWPNCVYRKYKFKRA
jgi:hypothetical protein